MSSRFQRALRAWHGSPHDFDEFKDEAIGSGEGAQVYGHGHYVAEQPEVARSYRDNLSMVDYDPNPIVRYNGIDLVELARESKKPNKDQFRQLLGLSGLDRTGGLHEPLIEVVDHMMEANNQNRSNFTPQQAYDWLHDDTSGYFYGDEKGKKENQKAPPPDQADHRCCHHAYQ